MSPETRAFLDRVRDAEDPTAEDERRVRAAVRASVAAGVVVAAGAEASKLGKLLAAIGPSGAKLAAAVVCVGAAAGYAADPASEPAANEAPAEPPAAVIAVPRPPAAKPDDVPEPPAPEPTAAAARPRAVATVPVEGKVEVGSPPPAASSLREEIELLASVQEALRRGEGEDALRKLDAHDTDDRQLAAERLAARVLALCAIGRDDEAHRIAAILTREHPTSIQRQALSRSCASTPEKSEE